jgi:serine/threonine-protein kinase mTOR
MYFENLPLFVKDTVLLYLDHLNPIIRHSVAQVGSLLYTKQHHGQLFSKQLMIEILEKFLTVVITDPEDSIRLTMLTSLN